jgi:hypothetical protein
LEVFIIMHDLLEDSAMSAEAMATPNLRCRQYPKYRHHVRHYYKKAEMFPGSSDGHRDSTISQISVDDI